MMISIENAFALIFGLRCRSFSRLRHDKGGGQNKVQPASVVKAEEHGAEHPAEQNRVAHSFEGEKVEDNNPAPVSSFKKKVEEGGVGHITQTDPASADLPAPIRSSQQLLSPMVSYAVSESLCLELLFLHTEPQERSLKGSSPLIATDDTDSTRSDAFQPGCFISTRIMKVYRVPSPRE